MDFIQNNTCCFIGHRTVNETCGLKDALFDIIVDLIENKGVEFFLFGSRSEFNTLCYSIVNELSLTYSNIRKVYVRAEYPCIDESYEEYLLQRYDYTYFSEKILNAGRATYIERNYEMIDKSAFCVFYYDKESCLKSGTHIAYKYAQKMQKQNINVYGK